MHLANLSFNEGQWSVVIDRVTVATDHVLARLLPETLAYVEATWGPYEEVYYEVEFVIEPGRTPLEIELPMTLVTSIYDPLQADEPYETIVLTDTDATTTELHQLIYDGSEATTARLRLSLDDIVSLVPGLSVAGSRLSSRAGSDALADAGDLTPGSLLGVFEAWPPPAWKRSGLFA